MDTRPTRAHIAATFLLAAYVLAVPTLSIVLQTWTVFALGTAALFGGAIILVAVLMIKDRRQPLSQKRLPQSPDEIGALADIVIQRALDIQAANLMLAGRKQKPSTSHDGEKPPGDLSMPGHIRRKGDMADHERAHVAAMLHRMHTRAADDAARAGWADTSADQDQRAAQARDEAEKTDD